MGKAFSEEDRVELKVKLMDTALELYHENGKKSLSIRELTKRAGISLGSFYNFWEDKDALVLDVMKYRVSQKLDALTAHFEESLKDPAGFLVKYMYEGCMDIKEKIETKPIYRESILQLRRETQDEENRVNKIYIDFLDKLVEFWTEHKAVKNVDVRGLINVFATAGIMMSDYEQLDAEYFEEIFKMVIDMGIRKYIEL